MTEQQHFEGERYTMMRRRANEDRSRTFARWTIRGQTNLVTRITAHDIRRFTPEGR